MVPPDPMASICLKYAATRARASAVACELSAAGVGTLALHVAALLDALMLTDGVMIGVNALASAGGRFGSSGPESLTGVGPCTEDGSRTGDGSCSAAAAAIAAGRREVSRPMKNATAAISTTKRSPAVAISHFGMCIGNTLSSDRTIVPRRGPPRPRHNLMQMRSSTRDRGGAPAQNKCAQLREIRNPSTLSVVLP